MKDKLRREGMAEQKSKFMSTAGTPAQTSMRYGSMTDAEEKANAAKPAPMFEAPKAAPKGTVVGVPEEMTAEAYPGIPEKPEMGSARRTLPSGPVPVVEDKPDKTTAFGLTAPVAKMMRENGMSDADAKQVAENMVELYKQSNDPNLRAWLEDVAEKQTASKMTESEKWRNAMIVGGIMGASVGAGAGLATLPAWALTEPVTAMMMPGMGAAAGVVGGAELSRSAKKK